MFKVKGLKALVMKLLELGFSTAHKPGFMGLKTVRILEY